MTPQLHDARPARRETPPEGRARACDEREWVAVDTETTGLPWHERVVEIAGVRFRGDRVLATWRTLVNPRRPVPEAVTRIHGLTDADLVGAPDAREALGAFARFCGDAPLLAHNAPFDRDILAAEYARAGMVQPRGRMYCTLRLSRALVPESPRHGLAALAEHLALPSRSTHRALHDAELTRQLFLACRARMRGAVGEVMGALATEPGTGAPWGFAGAVRRVLRAPAGLEAITRARAAGAEVTLTLRDGRAVRGRVLALYARGADARVDVETDGATVESVALGETLAAAL